MVNHHPETWNWAIDWLKGQHEIMTALQQENKRLHYNLRAERETYADLMAACEMLVACNIYHHGDVLAAKEAAQKALANAQHA